MASQEDGNDGNDENPTTADGQQQQGMKQERCVMYWMERKKKKKTTTAHPSDSMSSDGASWEVVSQADSCRLSESECGLLDVEDQKSGVLDGSVHSQIVAPASPDNLPGLWPPTIDNDGDYSPDPTKSSPAGWVIRSALSDDDSVYEEAFNDDDCRSLPGE